MNTADELKAIRYLINDLILYVYDLRTRLEVVLPKDVKPLVAEPNIDGSSISFDLFSLGIRQYNNLVRRHGIDVVNRACARLDEYIKINEGVPFGKPYIALRKQFIPEVILDDDRKLRRFDLSKLSLTLEQERNNFQSTLTNQGEQEVLTDELQEGNEDIETGGEYEDTEADIDQQGIDSI